MGLSLVLVLGLPGVAAATPPTGGTAGADVKAPPKPGTPEASKLARVHFKRALDLYRNGKYRESIRELNQAIVLDPKSKDLVYNRGLVYEKLGQIDDAIQDFQHYLQLETDPEERARGRAILRRLKGARHEVETTGPVVTDTSGTKKKASGSGSAPASASAHGQAHRGRLDGWVYVASGVAAAAVIVGSVFGFRALATEPGVDQSTSGTRTYQSMQDDQRRAHSYALTADLSFAVGILSGAAAGALYFLRAPAPASSDTARAMPAMRRPMPVPGFSWGVRF